MSLKSVYLPQPSIQNNVISIADEEHRHLLVTRIEKGELVEVFDGRGSVWTAEVVEMGKRRTLVLIQSVRECPKPAHPLILGQALIRMAAFEVVLEKAVEIGVTHIIPFVAARSNVGGGERRERWQRIVVEAAKQSKRFLLPVVDGPTRFDELLSVPAQSRILFAERDAGSLKSALAGSPVIYLVGPEGGWTDEEMELARRAGFQMVSLGTGILKSETAAIVGGSLIRYELGDM